VIWIAPAIVGLAASALFLSSVFAAARDVEATLASLRSFTTTLGSEVSEVQADVQLLRSHLGALRLRAANLRR
jgi:hypothetical protein